MGCFGFGIDYRFVVKRWIALVAFIFLLLNIGCFDGFDN